ncbi:RIP metalloprotease RseP [Anaeroselena agilis]|uniref:Zinc metalloprotease n=1 Tax=Anaeroselena agilis TaxID=3063788 RepID=A0ABU3NX11_9FIRM|nr:RIP metalloprotease RseP [Selenomonadales bacterium 4137-cl]
MTTTIIATVFVLGLLVLVHEIGHFVSARLTGMAVREFGIGFGPALVSKRFGETVYSLNLVPLGGFVKIAGMDPDEEQTEKSYGAKPIWARMLVIAAGPVMNFVLPALLFFIVLLGAGVDNASDKPIIGSIIADRPAARAGLAAGDRIMSVNGGKIDTWMDFVQVIRVNADKKVTIVYDRGGVTKEAAIVPEYDAKTNRGIIGVTPQVTNYRPGPGEAFVMAVKQTVVVTAAIFGGLVQMITGQAPADVAGPIGVAQMTGQVARMGFLPLLQFAAFLSINLGLINLLPVPVLDGGHLVTLAFEAVRGKPLSRSKLQIIQTIGFALLMTLMLLATFKDITRIFW